MPVKTRTPLSAPRLSICGSCVSKDQVIGDLTAQNLELQKKLDSLTNRVLSLELQLSSAAPAVPSGDVFSSRLSAVEKEIELVRRDFPLLICQAMSEFDEKKSKELNLVVVGLAETVDDDVTDTLQQLADDLSDSNVSVDVNTALRFGKKGGKFPRITKVKFGDKKSRIHFLTNFNKLKNGGKHPQLKNAFCRPDLTLRERTLDKEKRDECKLRRANGEDVVVRNFNVVPRKRSVNNPSIGDDLDA